MKNITLRYSITQFSHWAAASGATAYATTYLLGKGMPAGWVGALLAAGGLLSCFAQPLLASIADRSRNNLLNRMLIALSLLCMFCFGMQMISGIPLFASGMLYLIAICCSDAMVSLLNALSVSANAAGFAINYGVARGVGAMASAAAALALGHVIARKGFAWMLVFLLIFRLVNIISLLGFPRIEKPVPDVREKDESCSIPEFFRRYRWYCISLAGVLFLGMFHAMTENYLIAIMQRLGGDSSHVGTALFISSMSAAPVIFFFKAIQRRIRVPALMKIAAISFLLKAVLFCLAPGIESIYLLQLMQISSYALLCPAQLYYAEMKVGAADMVKGQAFITAAYALGCSAGNFAGGQLLGFGVDAMLVAGVVMAAAGTLILFMCADRRDFVEDFIVLLKEK